LIVVLGYNGTDTGLLKKIIILTKS